MKTIRFFVVGSSLVLLMWLSASFQAQFNSKEVQSRDVISAESDSKEATEELSAPGEEADSFSEDVARTQ